MPEASEGVFCRQCGTPIDQPLNVPVADRTPCPRCGSTNRSDNYTGTGGGVGGGRASTRFTPGTQARDWRQRWVQVQEHLKRLVAPRSEQQSVQSIQAANHDLHSFFVQAYHLKDSLIQESGTTGIPASTVERAITQDPHLALLADLANLDKHGKLTKAPRSGAVPVWGTVSAVSDGGPGWRLSLEILHNGKTLDGLTVAAEAVAAWERQLRQWGRV
jgi:hypothetical protein